MGFFNMGPVGWTLWSESNIRSCHGYPTNTEKFVAENERIINAFLIIQYIIYKLSKYIDPSRNLRVYYILHKWSCISVHVLFFAYVRFRFIFWFHFAESWLYYNAIKKYYGNLIFHLCLPKMKFSLRTVYMPSTVSCTTYSQKVFNPLIYRNTVVCNKLFCLLWFCYNKNLN